jgi:two-component system response regulator NreC
MSENVIRILLADDHAVLRAGLRVLLNSEPDMEVVGEASNGTEALERIDSVRPNVVVLDLSMPGLSGLDIIERITSDHPQTRVLVLTMHDDKQYILHVLQAGGAGYVLKSGADTELIDAIRHVAQGHSYLYPEATQVLLEAYRGDEKDEPEADDLELLSDREREVLIFTALGYSSREIGETLYLSPKTVDTYRQRVMDKLHLESRADLVKYALKKKLIDSDTLP